ncbi:MAG: PGF-pre-PGF domain-containing protein [Methanosarcina sp.]|uniref:PGF-pre-PGF domain-containing protein n=1 Tax=Methanosarcina sp. TaxID=2213 RepID=UPI00263557FF|nr:PGF-pre-PGF domain-containing protein [Methanosarcina sp.]MDD3247087.1 PGF-pre-PGF domain-containing protein [Methanosarcina sp.]MDD4248328.1 PGF-pre-PGF domain-containing protein [Methanosarcina sp.]
MKKYLSILLVSVLIFGAVLPCATAGAKANSSGDNSTIEEETTIIDVSDDTKENSVEKKDTIVAEDSVVVDTTIMSTNNNSYNSDTEYNSEYSDDDIITSVNTDDDYITANNSSVYNGDVTNIEDSSQTNIQYVETTQVNMDNSQKVTVDVKNDNSVVNNIYFESTTDSGKAKVVIEDLKDDTSLVEKPTGDIYKSFNIRIDSDNANDIEDAAVNFKVEKTWLQANGLEKSSIVLNMYDNDKWVAVPITITGQDSTYVYFTAEVSEYSTFAITSKTITVDSTLTSTSSNNNTEETNGLTKSEIIHILEMILSYLKGN